MNATYATARGHTLIPSRLWVPEQHLTDPATCDLMGIPGDLQPATKPQLGAQMLAEALDAGIEVPWAAADEVYGQDPELRKLCEERGVGYVFGVACSFCLTLPSGERMRADKALKKVPSRAWTITSCGAGSKGERRYAYAWIAAKDRRHHLLIRRNLHDPARAGYFWCFVPEGRPACLPILAAVCGRRWASRWRSRTPSRSSAPGRRATGWPQRCTARSHSPWPARAWACSGMPPPGTIPATWTSTAPAPPGTGPRLSHPPLT